MEQNMIDSTKENVCWIKPIKGHESYLITITGQVWSTKRKIWLKAGKTKDKHLLVVIDNETRSVHRLVFETFVRKL